MNFQLAGWLSPTIARVTETLTGPDSRRLLIALEAYNRNTIRMDGTWGRPLRTRLDHHHYDHGGEGVIAAMADELVEAILSACNRAPPEPESV